jgi:threonine dehydrogenase-like Zn-dependent dehydrogenase
VRIHSQINFAAAIDIIGNGLLNEDLAKLITHEFNLEDIRKAIEFSLEDHQHMKVVMKI